jgi:hypothetical protein
LNQLGLTGTYANYIEGEVSFDLLDEDGLPDIATSNRQDFDETDGRIVLLRALTRPVVRRLIKDRTDLAAEVTALAKKEKERRESESKAQFSAQVQEELSQYSGLDEQDREEIRATITNKIEGDVSAKQRYRVFISHARSDKIFASFIDEVLQSRGAKSDEIFYTSRTGDVKAALDDRSLGVIIRQSIVDVNTLIFYLTSRNFMESQYCLFEGGAGWATRGVSEYLKLNLDYGSIPAFLTNGKAEICLLNDGSIELSPELHNYLVVGVLNPMIEHLNRGRAISGEEEIPLFDAPATPSEMELRRSGTVARDHFEPMIVEHWDLLVQPNVVTYVDGYARTGA